MNIPNEDKFTGKADIYSKYRPSYPDEFIDYLYSEAGFAPESVIADVGAGTGILSRLLAARGSRVILVEPNADMQSAAKRELAGFPNCEFNMSLAQDIGLPDGSVDFVTAAQAFHWFDRERFKAECGRILRPGGKVVLVWNDWLNSGGIDAERARANEKYCPEFKGFSGGSSISPESYADFFEGGFEYRTFANSPKIAGEDEFIGGHLSVSYAPKEGTEEYAGYVETLKDIFRRYAVNGKVTSPILTRCYCGKVK